MGNVQRQKEKIGLKVRYVSDRTDGRSFPFAKHHLHARCVQLLIIVLHYGVEKTNRRIYEPNYDRTCFKKLYGADGV